MVKYRLLEGKCIVRTKSIVFLAASGLVLSLGWLPLPWLHYLLDLLIALCAGVGRAGNTGVALPPASLYTL